MVPELIIPELKNMTYSGRGIIIGMNSEGDSFIGYSLTGRSPSSQARRLVDGPNTGVIRTDVTDKTQLEKGNPALLLYTAIDYFQIRSFPRNVSAIMASNGAQTKLLYNAAAEQITNPMPAHLLTRALSRPFWELDPNNDTRIDLTSFEPDPSHTPRISAMVIGPYAGMHIVRRREGGGKESLFFNRSLEKKKGYLLTTYSGGNEDPLKPFEGEPIPIDIPWDNIIEITQAIFNSIQHGAKPDENFAVSSAAMINTPGDLESHIINKP